MSKDKSWTAPDTTAFKNVTPEDIPESTYTYKGDNVAKSGDLPPKTYDYKGDSKAGKGTNSIPKSDYNYKGDKVGH